MKRFSKIVSAALLIFLLTGCGQKTAEIFHNTGEAAGKEMQEEESIAEVTESETAAGSGTIIGGEALTTAQREILLAFMDT